MYRVLQESLNNAARHADPSQIQVKLAYGPGTIQLSIRDDGKGFDPARTPPGMGIGLDSMRERLAVLGGQLQVRSQPAQGTTLLAQLPLASDV